MKENLNPRKDVAKQTSPEGLPLVLITDTLLEQTAGLLSSFAEQGPSEGIVYWFGIEQAGKAIVTTLIVPNAYTSAGCIRTSAESNAEVILSIVGTPLVLIGQAHSHPGNHVRHSDVDDRHTFPRFNGAISIVVPYFAKQGFNLRRCGVHRFISDKYVLVKPRQVPKHVEVVPGQIDFRVK